MNAADLIARKRDGEELTPDEVASLVRGAVTGEVSDAQLAAFLMAVMFRGLSDGETAALTGAMVASGRQLDLEAELGRPVVDKHSTGGVGDKLSLVVGPLVAACGVPFAKMSGRALGHTGGTIDKLESIPGFRSELSVEELVAQVREVGLAIVAQSAELVPADRRIYALRNATATVEQRSLIAASVMSKKLAAGASGILLDVKVGRGAFLPERGEAVALAETMLALGRTAGRRVTALLSAMDEPLGQAVGNALEVREAVATLRGEGPADLVELSLVAVSELLRLADPDLSAAAGRKRAVEALESGAGLEAYERWIAAQGGDPRLEALASAPGVMHLHADRTGVVQSVDARIVAEVAQAVGAARDPRVGVVCLRKAGDHVVPGDVLAALHDAHEYETGPALARLAHAWRIGDAPVERTSPVLEIL
ncbi:MAG: pyrimidine-nucleoside phosphorylase [Gaiellaceae bacterium]|nr:pyrimidine-nucleoside phosphorylase [Gaiellaceae bacterium]